MHLILTKSVDPILQLLHPAICLAYRVAKVKEGPQNEGALNAPHST